MGAEDKKNCCKGCKAGQPGSNESCRAKLLMEQLEQQTASSSTENKQHLKNTL